MGAPNSQHNESTGAVTRGRAQWPGLSFITLTKLNRFWLPSVLPFLPTFIISTTLWERFLSSSYELV